MNLNQSAFAEGRPLSLKRQIPFRAFAKVPTILLSLLFLVMLSFQSHAQLQPKEPVSTASYAGLGHLRSFDGLNRNYYQTGIMNLADNRKSGDDAFRVEILRIPFSQTGKQKDFALRIGQDVIKITQPETGAAGSLTFEVNGEVITALETVGTVYDLPNRPPMQGALANRSIIRGSSTFVRFNLDISEYSYNGPFFTESVEIDLFFFSNQFGLYFNTSIKSNTLGVDYGTIGSHDLNRENDPLLSASDVLVPEEFSLFADPPSTTDLFEDITLELDENGRVSISPDDVGGEGVDGLGNPFTYTFSRVDFGCADVGTPTEVTVTVTTPVGLSATASVTVNVADNLGPTLVTNDVVIQLDADGNGSYTIEDVFSEESRDNCGPITFDIGGNTTVSQDDVANSPITRKVKGQDQYGNSARANVSITVLPFLDATPPFVDFGSEFTLELDENGHAAVTIDAIGGDEYDDNGEPLTFAFSQTDFDCSNTAAPTEVTITVTNAAGISASTVMNAIVIDKLGPTLVTNHVVVQLDAEGNGSYTNEELFSAETRDNCGGPISFQGAGTVNRDDVAASPFEVVVKGIDQNGNTTRTRATITVLDYVDTTPPTVSTKNITAELGNDGTVTIAATDIDNGSIDDESTDLTYEISQSQFVCTDFGNVVSVTLTVTDEAGNSASANATVTVTGTDTDSDGYADACDLDDDNDGILDTIECSSSAFFWSGPVTLDYTTSRTPKPFAYAAINGIRYFYTSNVDFSTTSNLIDVSKFPTEFGIPDQTSIRSDLASQNTLTFTQPMTNPVLVFASIGGGSTVNIDFQNDFEVLWIESGTTSVNGRRVTGTEGNIVIRFNGTFSSLNFDFLDADTYVNIALGADFSSLCDLDEDGITNDLDLDSDNDGCSDAVEGTLGFALDQTSDDRLTGAVDTNGVPILANGGQGVGTSANAAASCFFDLELDKIAPTLVGIPTDVTVECNTVPTVPTVTATDNHSVNPLVTFSEERIDGISNNNYTLTRTWTTADESGNTASGTQVITVADNAAPILVGVPADVTVEFNAVPAVAPVSATDNCGANPVVTFGEERIDGLSNNNYILTRTWTATDESGNTISGAQVITVEDATAPIVITKDITVYLDANGNATITPEQVDNGSSDESGEFTLSLDQTTFSCNDLSTSCSGSSLAFTGTGIASGANGDNIQNLGLNQLTMEAWVKPSGGTVNSIIRKAGDYDLYIANDILYAEVWYEGRASSAQYLYTGPSVSNSAWSHLAFTFDKANGSTGKFYVNGVETVATGAARSITQDITLGIGGSTEFGQSFTGLIDDVRIWSVERTSAEINEFKDFCIDANSVGLEAYFKIEANEGTILTDFSGNGNHLTIEGASWSSEGAPIESDGTEVTLTVTDASGNASSAIASVTVLDNIVPNITLNGNPTIFHDAYTDYIDLGATATDNCSSAEVSVDSPVDTDTPGSYTIILTATDASGNEASTTRTVIVRDITAPQVSTKPAIALLDEAGNGSISNDDVVVSATDDSGTVNVSLSDTDFACDDLGDNTVSITGEDLNGNSIGLTTDGLVGYWKFGGANPIVDLTGNWGDIEFVGNASINNGTLELNANSFARTTGYNGQTITSKTLISYVTLEDLDIRSGAAISIDGITTDNFDAIVYAERQVRRWMNGSSFFRRTQDLNPGFAETQTDQLIQMAITYENIGSQVIVTVYRNGVNIGGYTSANASNWTPGDMEILFGARHSVGNTQFGSMDARISKALLYDRALSAQEIAAMNGAPATVAVIDEIAPTVVGNNTSVTLTANGTVSISPEDVFTSGADNCGPSIYTVSQDTFGATDAINSPVTIQLTGTDPSGNATSVDVEVTVIDPIPVVVTQDITVSLNENGNVIITPEQIDNGSSSVVGLSGLALDITSFDCSNVGIPVTVTLTATSTLGSTATGTATVTVVDDLAPEVEGLMNLNIDLDASGNASIDVADFFGLTSEQLAALNKDYEESQEESGDCDEEGEGGCDDVDEFEVPGIGSANTFFFETDIVLRDNCGFGSITADKIDFTCVDIGEHVVTITVTDVSGNSTEVQALVTVNDVIAPEFLTRESFIIYLDESGVATVTPDQFNRETVSDNCGVETITFDRTDFDCNDVGFHVINITATDANGNVTVGQADVEVRDEIAPTVITQNIVVDLDENGNATISPSDVDGGTFDNCAFTLSLNIQDFSCAQIGENIVELTAHDQNGVFASANATVTVRDVTAPEFLTRESFIIYLDQNGVARVTPDQFNRETVEDNCGVETITFDRTDFDCNDVGFHVINITATDATGNVTVGQADVEVRDEIAPTVITQNITVDLDEDGNATISPSDIDGGTSDNCAFTLSLNIDSFTCAQIGDNIVELTAQDQNGVFASANAIVTVRDIMAPTVVTKDVTVELDVDGVYTVTPDDINNGTFDNCTFDLSVTDNVFDCSTLGEQTVILTATDASGNITSASAVVTVVDNAGPVILTKDIDVFLDQDGNASITLADVNEGTTDGCGVSSTTIDMTSFDCSNLGANAVTLTATDIHGNTTTETATVTVIDNIAPTVITKNITVDLDANGNATISPEDVLVQEQTTEDCSVTNARSYGMLLFQYVKRYRNRPYSRATAFTFINRGRTFRKNPDGTVTIIGTLVDRSDSRDSWSVRLNLKNARDWKEWSALGKTYEGNRRIIGDKYLDWTYYELGENSQLIGTGINRGETINLTATGRGFQIGEGANSVNSNFGISGQFGYATRRGRRSSGRFYFTLDNCISRTETPEGPLTDDNCSIASTSLDITSFDCNDIGDNTVNVTVTDKSGNATIAPATVTVRDVTAPVIRARAVYYAYLGSDGNVTINPAQVDAGSGDNCGIVSRSLSKDTFNCNDANYRRVQKVRYTVTDASGNSSSTIVKVVVIDNEAPVISGNPITLVVYGGRRFRVSRSDIASRVTDNCRVARIYNQKRTFTRANAGLNFLWVVATDNSRNRANGFVRVNVVDITKYGRSVPMCYKGRPIKIRDSQVQRWLSRGAIIGSCETLITMSTGENNIEKAVEREITVEREVTIEPLIELGAFPNPSQGETTIKFSSDVAGPAMAVVMSSNGVRMNTLFDGEIAANENVEVRYNTSDLPNGVYIIRLVTAGEVRTLKLMVNR